MNKAELIEAMSKKSELKKKDVEASLMHLLMLLKKH